MENLSCVVIHHACMVFVRAVSQSINNMVHCIYICYSYKKIGEVEGILPKATGSKIGNPDLPQQCG